jgi:hypothetical protein
MRGFLKYFFELVQKFAYLSLANQKRWKQANRKIVSAVDEQAALQSFGDERATFDGKFHAQHAAFAANLLNKVKFIFQLFQTGA